jgi:benzoyl-CoA reductase subunit C
MARAYLLKEFQRFKEALERLMDADITSVAISKSIDIYDRDRVLLQQLYDLRRRRPDLLTGRQVHSIVRAAMLMPKEEHTELLHGLLITLGEREGNCQGKVRLVLSGILVTNLYLLDMIEEAGGVIVDDDLYNGSRYFECTGDTAHDPMGNLAERFFNMMPCPTKHNPSRGWAEYIVQMARETQADGVIVLLMKYCDPHAFDYPGIKNGLEAAGIPHLLIETDLDGRSLGQVQTRLQAFFELVRGF